MLNNGTNKVSPVQSMWPLFCNEVGLSYEQEEKVRTFQRTLLSAPESWVQRHAAFATGKTLHSAHEAVQSCASTLGDRHVSTQSILSYEQRLKLSSWTHKNRETVQQVASRLHSRPESGFEIVPQKHAARNLYVLNHRLITNVLQKLKPAEPMVTGYALKKLSRRPLFESLSSHDADNMSISNSSGSLKRSVSEMSMEDHQDLPRGQQQHVFQPAEAQTKAGPHLEQVLGEIQNIIPAPPTPFYDSVPPPNATLSSLPLPTPVSSMMVESPLPIPQPTQPSFLPSASAPDLQKHVRKSSFLPPHLNVVPEEMFPSEGTEDFLMSLVDGDWAIGEGVDMDGFA